MIPKKIHYCWLSDDPMPANLLKCIDSWKKFLPDYELIKWDLNRFPLEKNIWVKQAFERKKYAFAADYIRLYALATEGGIYMDSDVEVIRSFDDLLSLPYFICKENSPKGVEAAVIGAEPHTEWINRCLDYYKDKNFVNADGTLQQMVLPRIILDVMNASFKVEHVNKPDNVLRSPGTVYVLPYDYFSPKSYVTKRVSLTENTYAIHHFAGSWMPFWKKILLLAWVPLTMWFPDLTNKIKAIIK